MGRKIKDQGSTKICVKCGKELPNTNEYFAKRYKRKDGTYLLATKCKECVKIESKEYHKNNYEKEKAYREANAERIKAYRDGRKEIRKEYDKQYYQDNKEKIAEQRKQRYEANREKEHERSKQYYEANKEKIAKRHKQYREDNKEKIAEQKKQYREANKEKIAEQRKQYYENNKDKVAEQHKRWYEANKDRIKAERKSKKRDIPKYKVCSSCGDILLNTTDNFRKVTKSYSSKCKKCECKASKQWYDSHKEQRAEHDKIYYREHKERKQETNKIWYQNNREERLKKWQEYRKSDHGKQVLTAKRFNDHNKRRLLEQNQGKGITAEQYKEVMSFFDWKCAYSGEKLKKDTRTLDHIVPLNSGGDHEIWNLVPMTRSLNSSKCANDMLDWYKEQDCFSEARLAKIYEWQEYARKKWKK